MKFEISRQIFEKKKIQVSNLVKIRQLAAELFHEDRQTDRQTDMTKLRVTFRNLANAPKMNKQHAD